MGISGGLNLDRFRFRPKKGATIVTFTSTTVTVKKEDETDSTATMTTTACTSVWESEWDDDIIEGLTEIMTLANQTYFFGQQ